tara:strand:- start:497 stop:1213 length:717 start_codon:yes stop_codon:yes gene_type:complete
MANAENLTLFLKAIKAVAKQNEHPIPPHLTPLTEGRALPETDDLVSTLKEAGQQLTDTQCACLFANVANLNFKDHRKQDRKLFDEAEEALRIDSRDARDVIEAVETRLQTQQSFRRSEDWDLFCAGLIAMAKADGVLVNKEQQYIQRYIPDLKHLEAGQKIATEKSHNDLGEALGDFSGRQRRCLAAHVVAIMFIDGEWKGSEQEFLEIAERRMKLVQFDKERIMKGIFTLFNVSVFS